MVSNLTIYYAFQAHLSIQLLLIHRRAPLHPLLQLPHSPRHIPLAKCPLTLMKLMNYLSLTKEVVQKQPKGMGTM
jgi:hypothetical protein